MEILSNAAPSAGVVFVVASEDDKYLKKMFQCAFFHDSGQW